MNLLAFLAIPSFIALCFLAVAHTFQTMSLRLSANAPFPSEALLQEYFTAAPAIRTAPAARVRTYERLVQNYATRSGRFAFSYPSAFLRMPVPASYLLEYRRTWPDSSFRVVANPDAKYARAIFPRRRTRLSALTRRPRTLSTALMSYS